MSPTEYFQDFNINGSHLDSPSTLKSPCSNMTAEDFAELQVLPAFQNYSQSNAIFDKRQSIDLERTNKFKLVYVTDVDGEVKCASRNHSNAKNILEIVDGEWIEEMMNSLKQDLNKEMILQKNILNGKYCRVRRGLSSCLLDCWLKLQVVKFESEISLLWTFTKASVAKGGFKFDKDGKQIIEFSGDEKFNVQVGSDFKQCLGLKELGITNGFDEEETLESLLEQQRHFIWKSAKTFPVTVSQHKNLWEVVSVNKASVLISVDRNLSVRNGNFGVFEYILGLDVEDGFDINLKDLIVDAEDYFNNEKNDDLLLSKSDTLGRSLSVSLFDKYNSSTLYIHKGHRKTSSLTGHNTLLPEKIKLKHMNGTLLPAEMMIFEEILCNGERMWPVLIKYRSEDDQSPKIQLEAFGGPLSTMNKSFEIVQVISESEMSQVSKAKDSAKENVFVKKILKGPAVPVEISVYTLLQQIHQQNENRKELQYFSLPRRIDEDDEAYYIVFNVHGNGMDLYDFIDKHEMLTDEQVLKIFYQIVEAIQFLHIHDIVHRDIKDENILINEETLEVKLIDFGASAFLSEPLTAKFKEFHGTINYAPVEVLTGKAYTGPPQDVWALGILLYVLSFKDVPFRSPKETMQGVLRLSVKRSPELIQLIRKLLDPNPEKRPTPKDILDDEIFTNIH